MGKKGGGGGGGGGSAEKDKDAEAVKIVKKGDTRKAEEFFEKNPSLVNAVNKKGQSVLMMAIEEGAGDIAVMLIEMGAKVNAKDRDGKTALHYCIMEEDDLTALDVVKAGVKLTAQDNDGETALHLAARLATEGAQKITIILMSPEEYEEEGSDGEDRPAVRKKPCIPTYREIFSAVRLTDENGSAVMHLAASEPDCEELAFFLIDTAKEHAGSTVDIMKVIDDCTARGTPFLQACSTGNVPVAMKLLESGASLTAKDEEGVTPLHEACMDGCDQLVNAILDRTETEKTVSKANLINAAADDGSTCIHYAAMNGFAKIIKTLLEVPGVDFDTKNSSEETPIEVAWVQGKADVVEVLKEAGAGCDGLTEEKRAKKAVKPVADTSGYTAEVEKKMVNRKKQIRDEHRKMAELTAMEQEENEKHSEEKEAEVAEKMQRIQEAKKNQPQTYELNAATLILMMMAFTWVCGTVLYLVE